MSESEGFLPGYTELGDQYSASWAEEAPALGVIVMIIRTSMIIIGYDPRVVILLRQMRHVTWGSSLVNFVLVHYHFDGLIQKRRNSIALAMELRFCCIEPLI